MPPGKWQGRYIDTLSNFNFNMFEETISSNKNCLFPILFIDLNSTIVRAHILAGKNCVSYLFLDNFFDTQCERIFNGYTILVRIINPSPNTSILFLCKDWYWHPIWTWWLYDASFELCSSSWCWNEIQIAFDAFCDLRCTLRVIVML